MNYQFIIEFLYADSVCEFHENSVLFHIQSIVMTSSQIIQNLHHWINILLMKSFEYTKGLYVVAGFWSGIPMIWQKNKTKKTKLGSIARYCWGTKTLLATQLFLFVTKIYYYYTLLRGFLTSISWWFLTGVWVTTSLQDSSQYSG